MKVKQVKFLSKCSYAMFCEATLEVTRWFKTREVKRNVYLSCARGYWMSIPHFMDTGKSIPYKLWESVKYQMLNEYEKTKGNG